jgi:phosphate transport system protein
MENKRLFDLELKKLTGKITEMCTRVNEQVNNALVALNTQDLELAKKVIQQDDEVDRLDVKIEKLCQKIFALQQPVASDLRYILSALKINNDLERIGDHAVNIAKRVAPLAGFPSLTTSLGIDKTGAETSLLFKEVVLLVQTHNLEHCQQIYSRSAALKESCEMIAGDILAEMKNHPEVVDAATNILIVTNMLERIASYSNNIAESITFVVAGKIVRHKKKTL